jgi:putative ABC transport system permease protein
MPFHFPRLSGRRRFESDMAEEMRLHIEHRVEDLVRSGTPRPEAHRLARIEFGSAESVKEECRSSSGFSLLDEIASDCRYTCRILRKSPAFALVAIAVLGVGIGACTAMFSVVNSVLLRPLPYPEPDRIVRVLTNNPPLRISNGPTSYPDFRDWSDSGIFRSVGVYHSSRMIVSINEQSEPVIGATGTSGVFSTLGVAALRGRLFTTDDDRPSDAPVAVLTERFWRRRLGGNELQIGSPLRIDGRALTVVGVVPAFLSFDGDPELWISPSNGSYTAMRLYRFWHAVARLPGSATRQQAQERLRQLCRRLASTYPDANKDWGADLADLKDSLVGETRAQLLVLLGSVFLVLLVVCANVATLFLVRATAREREIAVRAAIGASRGRIARQLVTESAVIAAIGAVVGTMIAAGAIHVLRERGPQDLPRLEEISVDSRALALAAGLALITGVFSGVAPALYGARKNLHVGMQGSGRTATDSRRKSRFRALLVTAEVACSVMLLAGAGLLGKSFWAVMHEDLGFRPDHLLTLFVSMPASRYMEGEKYQTEKVRHYVENVVSNIQSLPGADRVAAGMYVPGGGGGWTIWQRFHIVGESGRDEGFVHGISQAVTPDYFRTLGIPVRAGRLFTASDNERSSKVAVVNQAFVVEKFGAANPLGRRVIVEGEHEPREIVGVVANVKVEMPTAAAPPQFYLPQAQNPAPILAIFVRSQQKDPLLLSNAVQRRILDVDRDIPAYQFRTADQVLTGTLAGRRFLTGLMSGFAAVAVLLAVIGLYGVLGYTVAHRTREFGVRLALGARGAQVIAVVLRQGLTMVIAGVAAGFLGAFALSRVLSSLLYNVSPHDALVFSIVPLVIFAVGAFSCWLPARRAANVDPAIALRWE